MPGQRKNLSGHGLYSNFNFSKSRRPSAVLLHVRHNPSGPEGFYRCDVFDNRNITQSLFMAIHNELSGKYFTFWKFSHHNSVHGVSHSHIRTSL